MLSIYISTVHFYQPLEKSCRDLSTQNIPPDNFYPKYRYAMRTCVAYNTRPSNRRLTLLNK